MQHNPISILVTRPDPQGSILCQLIESGGDRAIHFPTIDIAPPSDEVKMHEQLSQIGDQHWLIFISPQAVIASIPHLRRAWPVLPETVRFAAIGAGTAQALKEAGYQKIVFPDHEFFSERSSAACDQDRFIVEHVDCLTKIKRTHKFNRATICTKRQ